MPPQPPSPQDSKDLPVPDVPSQVPATTFTRVDNNLTSIGFFTASSKRSRKAIEKTALLSDEGVQRRVTILPSAKYGMPITQDQDYWLALMKLVSEHVRQFGRVENPFTFTTAELRQVLGQTNGGKNYEAVYEWLSVMNSTAIEGGSYNAARKTWCTEKTHAVDRVVAMGKQLPDGRIADRHFIWFSQWQLDNINSGHLIPIELSTYTQLKTNIAKTLVPHLQEWLYASQRDKRFEKQYEDLCHLLGITTYEYRSKIEEKLGPPLDELVAHGYISEWSIEQTASGSGFKVVICHGDKFFNDRRPRRRRRIPAEASGSAEGQAARKPRQQRLQLAAPPPEDPAAPLIAELAERGIGESDARQLLAGLPEGQPVLDQLEWGDYLISRKRGGVDNPPGFYISLVQRNVPIPAGFLSSRRAREQQAAERARRQILIEQREEAERAEREEYARMEARLASLTEPERRAIFEQAKAQLLASHPGMAVFFRANPEAAIHDGAVRGRMHQILAGVEEPEAQR